MKKLIRTLFLFINILVALGLAFAYLSTYIAPDKIWFFSFFGLIFPYLLLANVLFFAIWLYFKPTYSALSLLTIIFGFSHVTNYIQFSGNKKEVTNGLKVLSYNVHHFTYDLHNNKSNSPELIDYLKEQEADIICLQETRLFKRGKLSPKAIRKALPKIKHLQLAHTTSYAGPLTLSRYPILKLGEIRFEKTSNMVLYSDILLPTSDTIRVYNCHFQSYRIRPDDYTIIDTIKIARDPEQIKQAREIGSKLKRAYATRAKQARKVADHIQECPYQVIVCGDFNDTPVSYTYRKVRGDLSDAFVESGYGIANTYRGKLPSFRIDYILYDEMFSAFNFRRDKTKLSDHYPVSCTLEYN